MSKHLERDLVLMQRDLMTLSVEEAIHKAIKSLETRDPVLARKVIEGDRQIDEDENHIEEGCLKMLALHQPVAIDLRRTTAVLKINAELERMGDLAEQIAKRAIHLSELPPIPLPPKVQRMTDLTTSMVRQSLDAFVNLDVRLAATSMVRQSLDAFVNLDVRLAATVCRLDDEVDRYNSEIIEELILRMRSSSDAVQAGLSMFSAVRHLERIADHATSIAEDVVYLAAGEIVRHRPKALEITK